MKNLFLTTSLLTGIAAIFFAGCASNHSGVIDENKLAAQYCGNDTGWYLKNIPFFECSDKQIEEVYYYRWQLYKAHIRNVGMADNVFGAHHYVLTEFINDVSWDIDPYSTINLASGHFVYEGRWLKDRQYMNSYINYLYAGGGDDRRYTENVADAVYAAYEVDADTEFLENQFSAMQNIYNMWLHKYDMGKGLYHIDPIHDGTEYTISSIDASGGITGNFGGPPYTNDGVVIWDKGASDAFWGGEAFRPTINSYQYANAIAIAKVAALKGDGFTSRQYLKRAEDLKEKLNKNLWSDSLGHYIDRYALQNQYVNYWDFTRGRELAGFVPWAFNMPDHSPKYTAAWKSLMDTARFLGKYGIRTLEPSYPYYMKQFKFRDGKPDCHWNGPSWPFEEAQVLAAMVNLLNNYTQDIISPSDYLTVLRRFTQQHYYNDGTKTILNLQEDYNPDTGKPIAYQRAYCSDHYNHSRYADLVITGLCGLRPSEGNTLVLNPLVDGSVRYFCLQDVLYHGHKLTVVYDADGSKYHLGKGLTVLVDGKKATVKQSNGKYEVEVGAPVIKDVPVYPESYALNTLKSGYPAPSASVNNTPDSLYQAIDGRTWFFDQPVNRWSTIGSKADTDWYALDFGQPRSISSVRLSLYADGKTYAVPAGISIEYQNGGQWQPVKIKEQVPAETTGNTTNTLNFDQLEATQLKITFNRPVNAPAVAVGEVECY